MASRKAVSTKKSSAKKSSSATKASSSKKSSGAKKSSSAKKSGSAKKSSSAKKAAPARKASSKKAPARKAPAKKASAKKSPARKTSSKKAPNRLRNIAVAVGAGAVAATAVVAGRRALRGKAPAVCTIANRGDVSALVLTFLAGQGFADAAEGSRFPDDIPLHSNSRKTWWRPLRDAVIARGCKPGTFSSGNCGSAKSVSEIVDALWDSVKAANAIA